MRFWPQGQIFYRISLAEFHQYSRQDGVIYFSEIGGLQLPILMLGNWALRGFGILTEGGGLLTMAEEIIFAI
jgi:hypothetical protein